MNIYKSSDLTHKRAEVMREAEKHGVVVQMLETNGKVRKEFVMMSKEDYIKLSDSIKNMLAAIK